MPAHLNVCPIGPYHHGKDGLKAMEELKTKHLHHLLQFTQVSLREFVSCVSENETRLRDCYQKRINFSTEKFVRMMVVDAAFVIMVMMHNHFLRFHNEELLFDKRMITDIRRDMILLENQLPFFILDHLLALSNLVDGFSMVQISSNFFDGMFTSWVQNPSEELNFSDCKHLVDFFRIVQHPLELSQPKALDVVNLPSAVELHRAGVKFKRGSSTKLLDINFHDGILEIPLLRVFTFTEILFRNLQAFEQCHFFSEQRYFNNYIFMISSLITDKKDVEILCKEGIIENRLHDNEKVVHLFHNLGEENILNTENFYFTDVMNDLNKYCSKRSNRWRASLVQSYLYNPWAIIFGIWNLFSLRAQRHTNRFHRLGA